jgi:hypothetical protein
MRAASRIGKRRCPNQKVLLQWLPFIVGSVIVAALTLLARTRVGTLNIAAPTRGGSTG